MRIRRYTGKDAQEAMLKVKMDLGSEAIILSTRKVRKKGLAGLFGKPLTEVLAAIDEDYGNKRETSEPAKKPRTGLGTYNRIGEMQPLPEDNPVESLESRMKQMETMLERIYDSVGKDQSEKPDTQKKEAENTKAYEASVTNAAKGNMAAVSKQGIDKWEEAGRGNNSGDSEVLSLFQRNLTENDIEPLIIQKVVEKIMQFVQNPKSYEEITLVAEKILVKVLGQPQGIQFREDGKPTVVLFIGPTGVGKTTTLAKIAADYSLNRQKRVGLITADTYRIAAVEQLKTYAEILNIPVSVIYAPQEIKEAISEHEDKNLILIDTAGRSHKNAVQFSELKMLAAAAEADEVYLVLNSSMGRAACRDIIAQYGFLQKYELLFTKLDEAIVPGMILNVRYATGKPLSYTTAGQSVPDDIEIANIEAIVKNMLYGKEMGG